MNCKQIIDSPIFNMESGEVVGALYKLIIDNNDKKISYFLIKKPADDTVYIVPFDSVVNIGDHSIIIDSEESLTDVNDYDVYNQVLEAELDILQKLIVDDNGEVIGEISDYSIDKKNGQMSSIICHEFEHSKKLEIEASAIRSAEDSRFNFDASVWENAIALSTEDFIKKADKAEEIIVDEKTDETEEVIADEKTDETEEVIADEKTDEIEEVIADEKTDEAEEVIADEKTDETEEVIADEKTDETGEVIAEVIEDAKTDISAEELNISGEGPVNKDFITAIDVEKTEAELREKIKEEIRREIKEELKKEISEEIINIETKRSEELLSEKEQEILELKSYMLKSQDEPLKQIALQQEKRIKEFERRIIEIRKEQETKFNLAMAEKEAEIDKIKQVTAQLQKEREELLELEREYKQKLDNIEDQQKAEADRYEERINDLTLEYEKKIDDLAIEYEEKINDLSVAHEEEIIGLEDEQKKLNDIILDKEEEIKSLEEKLQADAEKAQVKEKDAPKDADATNASKQKNSDRLKALHKMQQEKLNMISGFASSKYKEVKNDDTVAATDEFDIIPEFIFDSFQQKPETAPEPFVIPETVLGTAPEPLIIPETVLEAAPEPLVIPETVHDAAIESLVIPETVLEVTAEETASEPDEKPVLEAASEPDTESILEAVAEPEVEPATVLDSIPDPEIISELKPEPMVEVIPEAEPDLEPESEPVAAPKKSKASNKPEIIPEPEEEEDDEEEVIPEPPPAKKSSGKSAAKSKHPTEDDILNKQKASLIGRRLTKNIMDGSGNLLVASGKIIDEAIFEEVKNKKKDSIIEMMLFSE